MVTGSAQAERQSEAAARPTCCHKYHSAVELIGKRWTGAILFVLMDGPLRFSEIKVLVPHLSDRLLSEARKGLEAGEILERPIQDGTASPGDSLPQAHGPAL